MNTNTQSPATHTPTPYGVKGRFIYSAATHYAAPEGNKIAEVVWNSEVKNNPEQDAAFIVRACNTHAQLVAALKWQTVVLEEYWYAKNDEEKNWAAKDVQHAIDQARAALSAAQE